MNHPIGFGIIGCGMISSAHAWAVAHAGDAMLVGCFSPNQDSAHRLAESYAMRVFGTLEALLDCPDIDAVCICTPSGLHARQALAAIAHGKHIIIEKPMALTLGDCDAIAQAAKLAGVQACVISQMRFAPAVQAVREALAAGAFGRIVSASLSMKFYRSQEYYASPWRGTLALDGGGALMNQGIHGVDVLQYLVGPVRRVFAAIRTQTRQMEAEDSAAAVLEFDSGAIGTLEASTTAYPGYPRRLEICGDKGSVVLQETDLLRWDLPIPPPNLEVKGTLASASDPRNIGQDSHLKQVKNLVDAVHGKAPLLVGAKEGRQPLEIILAVYESARTGQAVVIVP